MASKLAHDGFLRLFTKKQLLTALDDGLNDIVAVYWWPVPMYDDVSPDHSFDCSIIQDTYSREYCEIDRYEACGEFVITAGHRVC